MSPETRKAAFFDIDNTLLNTKSMFSFQAFYLDQWLPQQGQARESYAEFSHNLQSHPQRHDRLALNRAFYAQYAGLSDRDVRAAAYAWFQSLAAQQGSTLWIQPAVQLAQTLRQSGYVLVAVSGSCQAILAPVIAALRFDHCLATNLSRRGDAYTGDIEGRQMIGEGKAWAIQDFARAHGVSLPNSLACGDHITDLPMLRCVGQARVVSGCPDLEAVARQHDWPILHNTQTDLSPETAHA